ncbi:MAG: hypothetical protein Q8M22_08990 [Actinomycetota bacterium]|nr:hypothetical protein [Actinomycetota bacterium]
MRPIRATIRPFTRAIVLSFLWNNRKELARWAAKAKESAISLIDSAKAEVNARRASRVSSVIADAEDGSGTTAAPAEPLIDVYPI